MDFYFSNCLLKKKQIKTLPKDWSETILNFCLTKALKYESPEQESKDLDVGQKKEAKKIPQDSESRLVLEADHKLSFAWFSLCFMTMMLRRLAQMGYV